MKKLIAMIGAVALSFGLFADAPTPAEFDADGLSFEAGDPGVPEEGTGDFDLTAEGDYGLMWLSSGEVTATVKAYTDGEVKPSDEQRNKNFEGATQANYLDIETDGAPLYRTFADATNCGAGTTNYVSAGVYMDVNVKFTAGEEAPAVGDGTKLAVWAQVIEGDDATTTNLVVTCGQLNMIGEPSPTNLVVALTDAQKGNLVGAWHRVTILSMIDTTINATFFRVYLDGNPVGAINGDAFAEGAVSSLVSDANMKYVNGVTGKIPANSLFPSMIAYTDDLSGVLAMVGFQGAGQIDDLWLDVGSPFSMDVTVVGLTNADITSVTANDEPVTKNADGTYTVPSGAALVIGLTAKPGYVFAGNATTKTVDATADSDTITIDAEEDAEKAPFAIILADATNYYLTLDAAVTAALDDDTITVVENAEIASATVIEKSITIDLNQKTLTYTAATDGLYFLGAQDNVLNCTVKNGNIVMAGDVSTDWLGAITFEDAGGLVKDVTLDAGNCKYGVVTCCDAASDTCNATVTCENVDVTIGTGVLFYCESEKMLLDADCSAAQTGMSSFGVNFSDAIAASWLGELTITGGTYTAQQNVLGTMTSPAKIRISGGSFDGAFNIMQAQHPELGADHDIAISGGTFSVKPDEKYIATGYWAKENEQGKWDVVAKGAFMIMIADTPTYFDTLAAAVEAAQAGDTITVIADAGVPAKVDVTKNLTIDLNGKKLATSTAGQLAILQVYGATLTINGETEGSEVTGKIAVGIGTPVNGTLNIVGGTYNACLADDCVIQSNGSCDNNVITVKNATFNSTDDTFYLAGAGTYTIENCVINGWTGIYLKSGALTVTGTTIAATGAFADPVANGNGASSTGDGIIVDAKAGYKGNVSLTLGASNEVSSVNGYAIRDTVTDLSETALSSLTISAGKFTSADGKPAVIVYNPDATAFSVTGGLFKGQPVAAILPTGYEWVEGEDGYYSVAQSKPAPTFSIQLVKATETHEGNVYTFAPAEGCVMSSVFANGAAVADAELVKNLDGTWTWTPTAETGDFIVVAAAKAVRTAPEHKWYESPRAFADYQLVYSSVAGGGSCQGNYKWAMGANNSYFLANASWGGGAEVGGVSVFDIDAIEANTTGTLAPTYDEIPNATALVDGATLMGSAISEAQGVALIGTRNKDYVLSVPLTLGDGEQIADKIFKITADQGCQNLCNLAFSQDGKYLYATTDGGKDVLKYEIVDSLNKDGQALKLVATYKALADGEVRVMCYANIDGVDYIFISNEGEFFVLDCSNDKNVAVSLGITGYKKCGMAVAGVAAGTPHLYICNRSSADAYLAMYDITIAGGVVSAALNKAFSQTDMVRMLGGKIWDGVSQSEGIVVSDDEATMVIGCDYVRRVKDSYNDRVYAVRYCPQYDVVFVNGDVATTNKVWEGDTTTAPEDPVKAGYTFEGWFNGDVAFDATVPVTADATYTAKFTATPFSITIALDGATAPAGWTAVPETDTVVTNYTVETADFDLPALVKDGFNFTGYVKGDETTTNLAVTIDCSLGEAAQATYTACFEEEQGGVEPGKDDGKTYTDPNEAAAAAAKEQAAVPEAVAAIADIDVAAYKGLFVAKVVPVEGGYKVVMDFTDDAVTALQPGVDAANNDLVSDMTDTTETTVSATVPAENVKAGLYYGIVADDELNTLNASKPASMTLATKTGAALELAPVNKPSTTKGFFKVVCSPVDLSK